MILKICHDIDVLAVLFGEIDPPRDLVHVLVEQRVHVALMESVVVKQLVFVKQLHQGELGTSETAQSERPAAGDHLLDQVVGLLVGRRHFPEKLCVHDAVHATALGAELMMQMF